MNNILFSIIVPIYNQEKYLEQCIKSVLEQEFTNFELILVNDGSTDSSGELCDKYKIIDKRIKVIHKENGGLPSARKAGAELASAEYIVALDSDDYMECDSLITLANIIEKHSPDVVSAGFTPFGETNSGVFMPNAQDGFYTGEALNLLKHKILYEQNGPFFTYGLAPSIWCNIMKKDLYIKYQQRIDNKIKLGEDLCVTFPAILDCNSVYILKKSLIRYRILSSSISHSFRSTEFEDLKLLIEHFTDIDTNRFSAENQLCVYILSRVYASLSNCAKNLNSYKDFKLQTKKIDSSIFKHLKKIKKDTLSTKAKFILLLIKRKCWVVFWFAFNKK